MILPSCDEIVISNENFWLILYILHIDLISEISMEESNFFNASRSPHQPDDVQIGLEMGRYVFKVLDIHIKTFDTFYIKFSSSTPRENSYFYSILSIENLCKEMFSTKAYQAKVLDQIFNGAEF